MDSRIGNKGFIDKEALKNLLVSSKKVGFTMFILQYQLCDKIPECGYYNYFTSFPEFATICNHVKMLSLSAYQHVLDCVFYISINKKCHVQYEPENGLSLLEIPTLECGDDYEMISQFNSFLFSLVDGCLSKSEKAVDVGYI